MGPIKAVRHFVALLDAIHNHPPTWNLAGYLLGNQYANGGWAMALSVLTNSRVAGLKGQAWTH